MKEFFADTYYYFAILNAADSAHSKAKALGSRISGRIATTAWVVQEVADGLSLPPSRASVVRFFSYLENDPWTVVIGPDRDLWLEGVGIYKSRPDKGWSLTDCISFVVMNHRGLQEALTADRHFEQAGFIALFNRE